MGLDSYIYRTTKEDNQRYLEWVKTQPEKERACRLLEEKHSASIPNFMKIPYDKLDSVLNEEDLEEYRQALHGLLGEVTKEEQLVYWRKAHGFHTHIMRKFYNPNYWLTERLYLTKDMIEELRNDLIKSIEGGIKPFNEEDNLLGEQEDFWDEWAVNLSIVRLSTILDNFDEDAVYFYTANL